MAAKLKIQWSARAVADLDDIYNYLLKEWTLKEAEIFLDLVKDFLNLIQQYPEAFIASRKIRGYRLGLIHKNVSAVYTIRDHSIYIVTLFDNRTKSKYR